MNYEFIKNCFNQSPLYSSVITLWKDVATNNYYVSRDFPELIQPTVDNSYMLLSKEEPQKTSPYRSFLTDSKQVTTVDFMLGYVEYGGSRWKLN